MVDYNGSIPLNAVCRFHRSGSIVGVCTDCGAYLCPQCALQYGDMGVKCPDCMAKAYKAQISEHEKHKRTNWILLAIGSFYIVLTVILGIYLVLNADRLYSTPTQNPDMEMWGNPVILGLMAVVYILLSLGFPFGIRQVIRTVRAMPTIVVVFSVLFFAVTIGLLVSVATIIGWVCMLSSFAATAKEKKQAAALKGFLSAQGYQV